MSSEFVLKTEKVSKSFPGVKALENVSFDLKAGEVHALCGENGAGKSTLIKVLSGIWKSGTYEGDFFIDNKKAQFQNISDAGAKGISVIYQELALVNDMTVAENIYLGHEPRKFGFVDWDKMYKDAENLLNHFKINIDPTEKLGNMGVGKQQLVEIVKALKKESHILILDEPTAALTEQEVDILLAMVKEIQAKGIACIYISHKLDEVFEISNRITVLRDGKTITTLNTAETNQSEVIKNMVGREIKELFPFRKVALGETLLSVNNLSIKDNFDNYISQNISFDLKAGEVLGIGGLMGSGRSELLMHLLGAFGKRSEGNVKLKGHDFNPENPKVALNHGLAMVTEDRKRFGLIPEQSNNFNLSISYLSASIKSSAIVDENAEYIRNTEISSQLRIKAPNLECDSFTLSGGNQQKVVLGKVLLCNPDIIFLDEPTRGIDVGAKLEVYELMDQLKSKGKAIILVSSEMPELMGLSDRIIMLAEGKIGGEFAREDFTQKALLSAAIPSQNINSNISNNE